MSVNNPRLVIFTPCVTVCYHFKCLLFRHFQYCWFVVLLSPYFQKGTMHAVLRNLSKTHPACPERTRCSCTRCAPGFGLAWGSCRCSCSRRSRPWTTGNTSVPPSLLLWRLSSERKEWEDGKCVEMKGGVFVAATRRVPIFEKLLPPARLDWRRQRRRWRSSASGRWSRRWWWAPGGRRCWWDCARQSSNSAGTCGQATDWQRRGKKKSVKNTFDCVILQRSCQ